MAKKKYDDIPRKKKKALKQKYNITKPIPKEELLQIAEKDYQKEKRQQDQRRRYNQNKAYLESKGIPTSIISLWTSGAEAKRRAEAYIKEQQAQKRKEAELRRYENKVSRLIEAGYDESEARQIAGTPSRQANTETIDRAIAEKKDLKHFLYIGFAEKVGGLSRYKLSQYSDQELIEKINARAEYAKSHIDESAKSGKEEAGNFKGIFKFGVYNSREEALDIAKSNYKRGYNLNFKHKELKLDSDRYEKVTVSNVFTKREFLEMTYTVTRQMLNWQVVDFMKVLKQFDRENGTNFTEDFK